MMSLVRMEPHGESVQLTYDSSGKLLCATSPFVGTITYSRNSLGFVNSVTRERANLVYQYQYNSNGQLSRLTDFDNNVTQYSYNSGQAGTPANGLLSSIIQYENRIRSELGLLNRTSY